LLHLSYSNKPFRQKIKIVDGRLRGHDALCDKHHPSKNFRTTIAAMLLFTWISPALAADKQPTPRPIFNPDGSFGFCLTEQNYPNGRKLTLALNPNQELNFGLGVPGGKFKIGSRYDLTWRLDSGASQPIRALGIDPDSVLLQFGKNEALLTALKASTRLVIGGGAKEMEFTLPIMPATLAALQQCNNTNKRKRDASLAKVEAAMPEALKALLVAAGVKDIAPLTMDDIPPAERPADFVWQTGKLLGGVRERMAPPDKTLDDLISLHLQGLKNKCQGNFKADLGKEEKIGGLALRPALIECRADTAKTPEQRDIAVAILFYLTEARRFTVFAHEGDLAAKPQAIKVRDGIAEALKNLAREMAKE
jgi:hypothetical protein